MLLLLLLLLLHLRVPAGRELDVRSVGLRSHLGSRRFCARGDGRIVRERCSIPVLTGTSMMAPARPACLACLLLVSVLSPSSCRSLLCPAAEPSRGPPLPCGTVSPPAPCHMCTTSSNNAFTLTMCYVLCTYTEPSTMAHLNRLCCGLSAIHTLPCTRHVQLPRTRTYATSSIRPSPIRHVYIAALVQPSNQQSHHHLLHHHHQLLGEMASEPGGQSRSVPPRVVLQPVPQGR